MLVKKNLHLNILPGLSQINKKGKEKRKKSSIYLKVKERHAREDRKQKSALMNEMLFS